MILLALLAFNKSNEQNNTVDQSLDMQDSQKRKFKGEEDLLSFVMEDEDEMDGLEDDAVYDTSYADKYYPMDGISESITEVFQEEDRSAQCNKNVDARDNLDSDLRIRNQEKRISSMQREVNRLMHNLYHHKLENLRSKFPIQTRHRIRFQ
ncbi:hypothetical protein ACA910_019527 [Epithemia clementina (nom. ined.)]